ncbi:gp9 [Listeria phage P35]|uniref:Putative structural protein n=1 Tax=Listeria phage LP-083-1 TaxID=1458854 RepID=A0A059T6G2_9CAUD|nr:gp9 [Listeria phage P35]AAY53194.1 gp9 [Listeria phage P35]AHL18974.1 putative structural protein [Listeria phage LP-083-1]
MNEFEFDSNIPKARKLIEKKVLQALEDIGEHMTTELAEGGHGVTSNNDTGEYAQKSGYKVRKSSKEVIVGNSSDYAIYYEFGTGEKSERGGGKAGGWFYMDKKGHWHFTRGSQASKRMRYTFRDEQDKVRVFTERALRGIN